MRVGDIRGREVVRGGRDLSAGFALIWIGEGVGRLLLLASSVPSTN